jgi:uncharacterized protein YraI
MQKHSIVAALALFLAAPALPVAVPTTAAAQSLAYAESGTTNLRAGPGTNYAVVGKVRGGEQVLVHDSDGGWYFVTVNGQEGWMAGSRLAFAQARAPVVVQQPYVVRQPYYVPGASVSAISIATAAGTGDGDTTAIGTRETGAGAGATAGAAATGAIEPLRLDTKGERVAIRSPFALIRCTLLTVPIGSPLSGEALGAHIARHADG